MNNSNRALVTCKVVHGLCAALIFPIFLGIGHAQAVAPINSDVEQVILRFLTAFKNLDWPVFRDCFSNSPTMFFPLLRRFDASRGKSLTKSGGIYSIALENKLPHKAKHVLHSWISNLRT